MKTLPEQYRDYLADQIDEDGVSMPPAIMRKGDQYTMMVLDLQPAQVYQYMVNEAREADELIFALDRYTKADQGTTLGDVMAGHHYTNGSFRPFVIEYQFDPFILGDVVWDNEFWNETLERELASIRRN